ncbi:MAG: cysteine desulfurase family protein [Candidatus Tumulicola sp.]
MNRDPARIYLDYAATTPLRQEVVDAMQAALDAGGFNPSSPHAEGRRARALLDEARDRVASALGASRKEIAFTGSGTESDNQAIYGVVRALGRRGHVVTSAIEHPAVLRALEDLAAEGFDVTVLPVDECGRIDPTDFAGALRAETLLASVMYANNEIGTVQPIAELAALARARGVPFHTDAVQAPGWLPIDVLALGVDLLSLSAHKFYGPKGVGVLFVRDGTALAPLIRGGGQEFGRRSGTENVLGIVGTAEALALATAERKEVSARVATLRDRLEAGIVEAIPGVRVNAAGAHRLPNNTSVSFAGADSETLLVRLDLEGVAVSAGSACTSGALEPSHVIEALGAGPRWQNGVIRFSLGTPTTEAEIDRVLDILPSVVAAVR